LYYLFEFHHVTCTKVHQCRRDKTNTTAGYDPVGYGLNPASLLMT